MQLYWGPRPDELEAIVRKAIRCFASVKELGPAFESWVQPGTSPKRALTNPIIDLADADQIRALLLKGQNRTDLRPRTVIPELGYGIRLWNRSTGNVEASISMRCGVYSEFLSQDAQNLLNLKAETSDKLPLSDAAIEKVFRLSADIWSAQGGRAWSSRNDKEHSICAI